MRFCNLGIALWLFRVVGVNAFAPVRIIAPSPLSGLNMFNGYHEAAFTPTNAELEEQIKKTEAAERKVEMLQSQLQHKETEYQRSISNLKDEMKNQQKGLKGKINDIANSFQNFKFDAHRQQLEALEASKLREEGLRKQVQTLKVEKEQLEYELKKLQERYVQDSMDWEDRLELEQDLRTKAEKDAETSLSTFKEQARKKLNAAKVDATVKLSRKEKELMEKDYAMKETRWDMGNKELKIKELEEERQSLRKLAGISWDLTKTRVQARLQKIKEKVIRNGQEEKNGVAEDEEDDLYADWGRI